MYKTIMFNIRLYFSIILAFFHLCINLSYSQSFSPEIVFKKLSTGKRYIGNYVKHGNYTLATYSRDLNRDEINELDKSERYNVSNIPNPFGFEAFSVKQNVLTSGIFYKQKAIYIFQNNNFQNIGYCLMDSLSTKGNYPIMDEIKALEVNNDYLNSNINLPPNSSIQTFEVDHNTYIERYVIGTTEHLERLMLDAFYPKDLELIIKPIIIEEVQGTMNALYQYELELQL